MADVCRACHRPVTPALCSACLAGARAACIVLAAVGVVQAARSYADACAWFGPSEAARLCGVIHGSKRPRDEGRECIAALCGIDVKQINLGES